MFVLSFLLIGCQNSHPNQVETQSIGNEQNDNVILEEDSLMENNTMKINVHVNEQKFIATLENNEATESFIELMKDKPLVIEMDDYAGFEKVGSLGKKIHANNSQITTKVGDIVLYNNSQIVIFYGSNTWSYTRLGKIDNLNGWKEALGTEHVTVTFSIGE